GRVDFFQLGWGHSVNRRISSRMIFSAIAGTRSLTAFSTASRVMVFKVSSSSEETGGFTFSVTTGGLKLESSDIVTSSKVPLGKTKFKIFRNLPNIKSFLSKRRPWGRNTGPS